MQTEDDKIPVYHASSEAPLAQNDFAALKECGEALLHKLVGQRWTDFNTHDPGVTLLEQLCYAMSEYIYRIQFPVEDLLAAPDAGFKSAGLGLRKKTVIESAWPMSVVDYVKAFEKKGISDVDSIWMCRTDRQFSSGNDDKISFATVYHIRFVTEKDEKGKVLVGRKFKEIKKDILTLFHRQRNLGEDLASVEQANKRVYHLKGRVAIDREYKPEEILAKIYHCCDQYLRRRVLAVREQYRLDLARDPRGKAKSQQNASPEQDDAHAIDISEFYAQVQAIDGVDSVGSLKLVYRYDLDLMSVANINAVLGKGRSLVIVALVGTDLHIRIFDASGKKVVDKPESDLISGEALTALKLRLNPIPDESTLSQEEKRKIIGYATSSAGHTPYIRKINVLCYPGQDACSQASGDGYDLNLISAANINAVLGKGRSLVIVAIIGTDLHIRIFDASGKKVVDKPESDLISGEALTALKLRLNPIPDESTLSQEEKRDIIGYATLSADHIQGDSDNKTGESIDLTFDQFAAVQPEEPVAKDSIKLSSLGREVEIQSTELITAYLQGLRMKDRRKFNTDLAAESAVTTGQYRDLTDYSSILRDLPAIYGVGPYGHVSEHRQQALQLRSYLMLFDQLLCDFTGDLAGLRRLFSTEIDASEGSYVEHSLNHEDRTVLDLDSLYIAGDMSTESVSGLVASMRQRITRHDNYYERKGRVFDFLLALYGEQFSQNSLRYFDPYTPRSQRECVIVERKKRFLDDIETLTKQRGAAMDCTLPCGESDSGLQRRLTHLLGFFDPCASPRPKDACKKLQHLNDLKAEYSDTTSMESKPGAGWFDTVPLREPTSEQKLEASELVSKLSDSGVMGGGDPIVFKRNARQGEGGDKSADEGNGAHFVKWLFKYGVDLEKYKLDSDGGDWIVYLCADGYSCRLGLFKERDKAVIEANTLRHWLITGNRSYEVIYVVEHLLLRDRSAQSEDDKLFNEQLTVIIPGWTARCVDSGFRQLARESLVRNCPAHLVANILWLELDDYDEFEKNYKAWHSALKKFWECDKYGQTRQDDQVKLKGSSYDLKKFLQKKHSELRNERKRR